MLELKELKENIIYKKQKFRGKSSLSLFCDKVA